MLSQKQDGEWLSRHMMLTSGLEARIVRAHLQIHILHTTHTSHKVKLISPHKGSVITSLVAPSTLKNKIYVMIKLTMK